MLLSRYERIFEDAVIAKREEYETKMLICIEEVVKRADQGEFNDMDGIEKYHILRAELIESLKQK